MDITALIRELKAREAKLYPLLIFALTAIVNRHEEFRTSIDKSGDVGIWDTVTPCYTIFHKKSETFSEMWSSWSEDIDVFVENYKSDIQLFGHIEGISTKPNLPENTFSISSLHWTTFTGFNLNIFSDGTYLINVAILRLAPCS